MMMPASVSVPEVSTLASVVLTEALVIVVVSYHEVPAPPPPPAETPLAPVPAAPPLRPPPPLPPLPPSSLEPPARGPGCRRRGRPGRPAGRWCRRRRSCRPGWG